MHLHRKHITALALTAIMAPAFLQTASAADADLFIDVATHDMPGMPGGAVTRGAMKLFGGNQASYGMAQYPVMPGHYLDVALKNKARPGAPAEQAIPVGLKLGQNLPLRSEPAASAPTGSGNSMNDIAGGAGDSTTRILL